MLSDTFVVHVHECVCESAYGGLRATLTVVHWVRSTLGFVAVADGGDGGFVLRQGLSLAWDSLSQLY